MNIVQFDGNYTSIFKKEKKWGKKSKNYTWKLVNLKHRAEHYLIPSYYKGQVDPSS